MSVSLTQIPEWKICCKEAYSGILRPLIYNIQLQPPYFPFWAEAHIRLTIIFVQADIPRHFQRVLWTRAHNCGVGAGRSADSTIIPRFTVSGDIGEAGFSGLFVSKEC